MNLVEIRQKFVELSGKYNLIVDTTDWADAGADYYINNAVQMLGKLCNGYSEKAKLFFKLSSGDYSITFKHGCRAIKSVLINNASTRGKLIKVSLEELKTVANTPVADLTSGVAGYYALAELRTLKSASKDALGTFLENTTSSSNPKVDSRGIVLASPVDGDYVVEVNGLFKNVELTENQDENFWTLEEYDLLIRAALYKLEGLSRGTENAKNWLSAIRDDVKEINFDIVEEESHDVTQMEG